MGLTVGAPADGSGRADPAPLGGAVDVGGPAALLASAVLGRAVLLSVFSILSGLVLAILGLSDFGASVLFICGGRGSGRICAAGFFAAGEDVACGAIDAGAEAAAGALTALESLT